MKKFINLSGVAALGLLCACAHYGTIPAPSRFISGDESISPQTIIRHGNFTEYTLPAGLYPTVLTHGPYSTLWFVDVPPDAVQPPAAVVEFAESSGGTRFFYAGTVPSNPPSTLVNPDPYAIISVSGAIYYVAGTNNATSEQWAIRVTPEGAQTYKDMDIAAALSSRFTTSNFTLGADGNLWFAYFKNGGVVSEISPSGFVPSADSNVAVHLDAGWCPLAVQSGPLSRIYTTARYCGGPPYPAHNSRLYVITTTGTIAHRFVLADNSNSGSQQNLAVGSDHNIWVLEPGVNKIARVTPTGIVTHFSVPTPNATMTAITPGADGALWFTEYIGNKIGRITTTGHFSEYPLPNTNSEPDGIVTCTTQCPPDGGVWFTEFGPNRIGKFVSPL